MFILSGLFSTSSFGQSGSPQNRFVSPADQALSIENIVLAPFADNMNGIYATPLQAKAQALLEKQYQWNVKPWPTTKAYENDYEEDPELVKKITQDAGADALLHMRVLKGPAGIQLSLSLFSHADGLLLLQETLKNYQGFEIKQLEIELEKLLNNLRERLPYRGLVLSRRGQEVTVNMGSNMNLHAGDELTVVQVTKINRHPLYKFLVSTDREILGRIRINKVDTTASFGFVTAERDRGVIQKGQKILNPDFVTYPDPPLGQDGTPLNDLSQRKDNKTAFGDNPQEWKPVDPPSFGSVAFLLGLGSFEAASQLSTESLQTQAPVLPSLFLRGELWVNPRWMMEFRTRQMIFDIKNPRSGSTPDQLNFSFRNYGLSLGYNFLLGSSFWGPKVQTLLGFAQYQIYFDSSAPLAFTQSSYSGMNVTFRGSFPWHEHSPLTLGAELTYFLTSSLAETPDSSGDSSQNNIASFGAFGLYKLQEKINLMGQLEFNLLSSTFTGAGTRTDSVQSTSFRSTTLYGGIEFLF
jgi:hypothetical protein